MLKDALTDPYGRILNYLRVSVTDRCNLSCIYCRKKDIHRYLPSSSILSYEDILRIVRAGCALGIDKVRITGGEPLERRDLLPFIEHLVNIRGLRDVSLTTNGIRLRESLRQLKDLGIRRLNISLDSLERKTFERISGKDGLTKVLGSIETALALGFAPLKLNMVVLSGINDHEIASFADLTRKVPVIVRFIEYMPSAHVDLNCKKRILTPEIKRRAQKGALLIPVHDKDNSRISERYRFVDGKGEIGFISPVSRHFCRTCNRLRLTADGTLRPCLLSGRLIDIKPSLRNHGSEKDLWACFRKAAEAKPGYCHSTHNSGLALPGIMSAIGG